MDNEPNTENESNKTLTFAYDKNGRMVTVNQNGHSGLWIEKRQYQSGNICPSKIETAFENNEGGSSTFSTTYTYNRFDEQGNWMERTCVNANTETEEDPWSEDGVKTTTKECITIEKRNITYYE